MSDPSSNGTVIAGKRTNLQGSDVEPLKVNVEEAHDIKLELDVRSQALITDYQARYPPRQSISSRQSSTISAPRSSKSLISRRMAKSVGESLCGLISPKAQVPPHCHKDDLRFKLHLLKQTGN
jgi:hypothetical protein